MAHATVKHHGGGATWTKPCLSHAVAGVGLQPKHRSVHSNTLQTCLISDPAEWWYKNHIHWCVCNDLGRTMSSHNLKERLHSPYSLHLISWKNNTNPLRVAYLKLQTRIQEEDVLSGLRCWWLAILHPYWLGQSWPLKGERVYKLTTTIWSIHMNTILSSRFSLVFKSTRTFGSILFAAIHHPCLLSIWSHIIHISTSSFHWGSPLPRPRSARDVVGSKQPPSQGYLAHGKCLCKESTGLIVFLCQSICYLPGANLVHIFHK